jgi:serine/threonine kinase 32
LEELLLEDNPLKARPRKKKGEKTPIPENETPEQRSIRIMEDMFTVFDFSKAQIDSQLNVASEPVDLCEREGYVNLDNAKPAPPE